MLPVVPDVLTHDFMLRAFAAGILAALFCAPLGVFLVLRRYSLMADTLSHTALAGVGAGVLLRADPGAAAVGFVILGAVGIDVLRRRSRIYGDASLAVFLSGSLALAVVLMTLGQGLGTDLLRYLLGSIITVSPRDLWLMTALAVLVGSGLTLFYKELFYVTMDEEAAAVSGIPVGPVNLILNVLTALTVVLAIRVMGVLLVGALMVIPALAGLQAAGSFRSALVRSVLFGVLSVVGGLSAAYYLSLPAGAAIVLAALAFFALASAVRGLRHTRQPGREREGVTEPLSKLRPECRPGVRPPLEHKP